MNTISPTPFDPLEQFVVMYPRCVNLPGYGGHHQSRACRVRGTAIHKQFQRTFYNIEPNGIVRIPMHWAKNNMYVEVINNGSYNNWVDESVSAKIMVKNGAIIPFRVNPTHEPFIV